MQEKVTRKQVLKVVQDKQSMYSATLRNGYYLSKLKDLFLTLSLLREVKDGLVALPKTD